VEPHGEYPRRCKDEWVEQTLLCRNSPVEMTDDRPSLENLPGDSRLDHRTPPEELISSRRRLVRSELSIREADRLIDRRLRDLFLRPLLAHYPAPQVIRSR